MATSEANDPLVPCQPGIDKFLGLLSNPGSFSRILGRSPIMNKKFVVRLSVEERGQLEALVAKRQGGRAQVDPGAHPAQSGLQFPWPGVV